MKLAIATLLLLAVSFAHAKQPLQKGEVEVMVKEGLPPLILGRGHPDSVALQGSGRHRDGGVVNPEVNTFAWATVFADWNAAVGEGKSCDGACAAYGLRAVGHVDEGEENTLCRFTTTNSTGASVPVYGNFVPGAPSTCEAAIDDGSDVTAEEVGFSCACCGTINRNGRRFGLTCPLVTDLVDSDAVCRLGVTWTNAGTQICRVPGAAIGAAPEWGSIFNGQCFVAGAGAGADDFEKLCYKINSYSGPPAPKHGNKNGRRML